MYIISCAIFMSSILFVDYGLEYLNIDVHIAKKTF
jgi:hypothetical protein